MSVSIMIILGALQLSAPQIQNSTPNEVYYELPRFWTNTGFCPSGGINRKDITATLLSDAVQLNLQYVAALPAGGVTHVRIHWLLELIEFVQFTQSGVPIYDFTNLDTFIMNLDDLGLYPVIELMGNPGEIFFKNPNHNAVLWEDFSYQVAKHYLNLLGAAKVLRWYFESWNEPDLRSYNKLNFTVEDYLTHLTALRRGLSAAGRRSVNSLHFPLRGPAGLFKSESKHPLCWKILQQCSANMERCPFELLTFHRKGNGLASEVLAESSTLLQTIYTKFPEFVAMPFSNDEADPSNCWSQARAFREDVHYAAMLVDIVLDHWSAKLNRAEFQHLQSISHDNAFLSYHPHEFSQRTLLAHFRMNNTHPPHSQFVQKPVYAAMGMLAKLAPLAADVQVITAPNGQQLRLLKTTAASTAPLHLSWLLLPTENASSFGDFTLQYRLPFELQPGQTYVLITEVLEQKRTDPAHFWYSQDSPAYPAASIREGMRRRQAPALLGVRELQQAELQLTVGALQLPWILLLRVCSNRTQPLKQPQRLHATGITQGEVLLDWRELPNSTQCLQRYELWFRRRGDTNWTHISKSWHLPFPTYQFAPTDANVNGFYKVRGIDVFNRSSEFSEAVEYFDIFS